MKALKTAYASYAICVSYTANYLSGTNLLIFANLFLKKMNFTGIEWLV